MPDIKTLAAARNVDLVNTFTKSLDKLAAMLSTCTPIQAAVGETLHQKKITGKLSEAAYTEGSDIPLSSYAYEDVKTYEVAIKPYRKQTTLQEVKKRGYAAAVDKTDAAMLSDIQRGIKKDFVNVLGGEGVTAVTGKNLVATAANAWAALSNLVEDYGFGDVEAVFLVNPVDFAKQIGESEVFSAFGISYIEFQSALPLRGATHSPSPPLIPAAFQSALPLRGATQRGNLRIGAGGISIRAPLAGSDG